MQLNELVTKADIEKLSQEIADLKKILLQNNQPTQEWLKSKDVVKMLHISPSTLQNLRTSNKIRYKQIRRTFYYSAQAINDFINSN